MVQKTIEQTLTDQMLESKNWITLRLDTHITQEQMAKLAEFFSSDTYIGGAELKSTTNQPHTHIVLKYGVEQTPYKIRKFIRETWELQKSQFSQSHVKSTIYKAIQYTIKDGKYFHKNVSIDWLRKVHKQSTKKYSKEDFKNEIHKLETQFYQDILTERQFAKHYNRLRLQYGQKPNETSQINYLMFHIMKKDQGKADEYAINVLEKAKNKISGYNI